MTDATSATGASGATGATCAHAMSTMGVTSSQIALCLSWQVALDLRNSAEWRRHSNLETRKSSSLGNESCSNNIVPRVPKMHEMLSRETMHLQRMLLRMKMETLLSIDVTCLASRNAKLVTPIWRYAFSKVLLMA
jgi:hypothetical protein